MKTVLLHIFVTSWCLSPISTGQIGARDIDEYDREQGEHVRPLPFLVFGSEGRTALTGMAGIGQRCWRGGGARTGAGGIGFGFLGVGTVPSFPKVGIDGAVVTNDTRRIYRLVA